MAARRLGNGKAQVRPLLPRRRARPGCYSDAVLRRGSPPHLPSGRFMPESAAGRALPGRRGLGLRLKPLSSGADGEGVGAAADAEEAKRSCSNVTDSFLFLIPAMLALLARGKMSQPTLPAYIISPTARQPEDSQRLPPATNQERPGPRDLRRADSCGAAIFVCLF